MDGRIVVSERGVVPVLASPDPVIISMPTSLVLSALEMSAVTAVTIAPVVVRAGMELLAAAALSATALVLIYGTVLRLGGDRLGRQRGAAVPDAVGKRRGARQRLVGAILVILSGTAP
jgi:hypothetical protein